MDFEKEYKRLVGRITKAHLYAQTDSPRAVLEDIYPSLSESEDERIREGLIHHLKELREWKVGTMSPIKVKEHHDAWIAYLEKQKEHTLSTEETELNSIAFLEQLGYTCIPPSEQKPVECSEDFTENRRTLLNNKKL